MTTKTTQNARLFDAVIFDLDATLFDHIHSLKRAMTETQRSWPGLHQFPCERLCGAYQRALNRAYDLYLAGKITYEEQDTMKVRLFFELLNLRSPPVAEMEEFRNTYREAYRASYRTTAGSLETLQKLRDMGIRVVILTNGVQKHQEEKAAALGILPLVESLISSELVGYAKPDSRAFEFAIDRLGCQTSRVLMVGDSPRKDIMGAVKAGLRALWYAPASTLDHPKAKNYHVIQSISQVLDFVESPIWETRIDRLHHVIAD